MCSFFLGEREQCVMYDIISRAIATVCKLQCVQFGRQHRTGVVISLLKHLLIIGVRAIGQQSFKHVILVCLGTGTMKVILKHVGTTDKKRKRLKMSVKTSTNWCSNAFEYATRNAVWMEGSGYIH